MKNIFTALIMLASSSSLAYELIDLGANVEPRAINNHGIIVGISNTDLYPTSAFRWSLTDGIETINGTSANAVNNNGLIAGNTATGAFLLDGKTYSYWIDYSAFGINQPGSVAGYQVGENPYEPKSLPFNPAVFDGNKWNVPDIAELYPRGTQEGVYADRFILESINNGGYAVGYKYRYGLLGTIAILIDTNLPVNSKADIAYLSIPAGGKATDINNNNVIAGTTGSDPHTTPVTYSRAYILDYMSNSLNILPLLEGGLRSSANDINDYNQVVGSSETLTTGKLVNHAFLWSEADGLTVNLNEWATDGWVLTSATAINDNGDIVGTGTRDGVTHGFLLTSLLTDGTTPGTQPPSQNQQPVADDIQVEAEPDSILNINILTLVTDIDGSIDAASIEIAQNPGHGLCTINTNGSVDYTPDPGYAGPDSFSYTVMDNNGALSNTARVDISITATAVAARNDMQTSTGGGALNPMMLVWLMMAVWFLRLRTETHT